MGDVYGQAAFALRGAVYTWADVVLAAALRGDWRAVADRARRGALLLARDGEGGEELVPRDEVARAADEWRYARDLVSAEETEAWLDRWDLDAEEWVAWISSDLLRGRIAAEPAGLELAPEELAAAVHAEAVCSGALERFARRLAGAAAVAARLEEEAHGALAPGDGEPPPDAPETRHLPFEASPEWIEERSRELARLERAFGRFAGSVASPASVEACLLRHHACWTRVRARVLSLRSEDAAKEALLSLREDGVSAEEVARSAGATLRPVDVTLDGLEPAARDRLLAARQGELVGPVSRGEAWDLFLVDEKLLPSASDPATAARATASLLDAAVGREIDARVVWRWKA